MGLGFYLCQTSRLRTVVLYFPTGLLRFVAHAATGNFEVYSTATNFRTAANMQTVSKVIMGIFMAININM